MTATTNTIWRALAEEPTLEEIPKGLDAWYHRTVGYGKRLTRRSKRLLRRAERIVDMHKEVSGLPDSQLRTQTDELRGIFFRGRESPADVNRALAFIREICYRVKGLRPHLVQVAGALGLESNWIVEMATGEGKTLTATMPAMLAAWRGRGCHVITVNDYLAQRDAEEMNSVYQFCGMRAACVTEELEAGERQAAYQAEITYATNKEVAADFLRDRLTLGRVRGLSRALLAELTGKPLFNELVQRGLECAIIDEADSVLIDEAVTPLIISGEAPNTEQVESFQLAREMAAGLGSPRDYRIDKKYNEISLTKVGSKRLGRLAEKHRGIWTGRRRREELVVQALVAKHLFLKNTHYILDEGKVVIVDESTGRLMPDRTWRDGLHQAIETKEEVEVNAPKATFARLSFQRFYRMYRRLSGMTGTGIEAQGELWQVYNLPFASIPTHRPCLRKMSPPRVFATAEAKWTAVLDEIQRVHATGQPILVGSRSIRVSELLATRLQTLGLEHQILNAVHHRQEAQIVAEAGKRDAITVATNMAGRGTDIKLAAEVKGLGGLRVIATERHETSRIDRQLYGRCSRQGDPGEAQVFVSLEDELPQRYCRLLTKLARRLPTSGEGELKHALGRYLFDLAEWRAQRMAYSQRSGVLQSDNWLDEFLGFAGREI